MAIVFAFIAKVLAKDYVYVHEYSVQCLCLEACFAGRGGLPWQREHIDFCSSHDIRALGIL